jgi:beta-glucosidase
VVVRTYESEQADRPSFTLPNNQEALVRAVVAANPRTVVVVMTGSPVAVSGWADEAAAVLQAWFPGQAQGEALARVLTGASEPGGRLPLTLPVDEQHQPVTDPLAYPGRDGRVEYSEGVMVGYRGYDALNIDPAYPFGHGLGYTTFEYTDLEVSKATDADSVADLTFTVTNTGNRPGSEVAQVYVGELPTQLPTPRAQLAAFTKLHLEPGASSRVALQVPRRAVSVWDVESHGWTTPRGKVELMVSASARDHRLTGLVTVGEVDAR